jgi:hypothetical protein
MKLKASYKYMDTCMLIGLTMFQIRDQPMVFRIRVKVKVEQDGPCIHNYV